MEHESANYERRVLGWLIDELIALGLMVLYMWLFMKFGPKDYPPLLHFLFSALLSYFSYIILTFILMKFTASTIGMLITGIKCIHHGDKTLSGREIFLRSLLSGLIAFTLANAIYMLMAHTERSAFDQLTQSYMVRR